MSTSRRRFRDRCAGVLLVALLAAASLLSACTSSPSGTGSGGGTASASVAPLTIAVTIADHTVSPSGKKFDVSRGQTVVLDVSSDTDDEIHAHTAGDGYELAVKAGVPATGRFVAADLGSFEIESHHLDQIIAILDVR